jgi:hypothetical protein
MSDNDKEKEQEKTAMEQQYTTPHQDKNDVKDELDNKHETDEHGEEETEPTTDVNVENSGTGVDVRDDNIQAVRTVISQEQEPKITEKTNETTVDIKNTEKTNETTVRKVNSSEVNEPKSKMSETTKDEWQANDLTFEDEVVYDENNEYILKQEKRRTNTLCRVHLVR